MAKEPPDQFRHQMASQHRLVIAVHHVATPTAKVRLRLCTSGPLWPLLVLRSLLGGVWQLVPDAKNNSS